MFYLAKETVDMIRSMTPRFGFYGFSEIVYYDKYSRFLEGKQERWADTVCRVINGIFTVRKTHMQGNKLPWDELYMQRYAREMAISLFKMEWTPPGRGLWAMGTSLIYERGSMFLNNCFTGDTRFFTSTNGLCTLKECVDEDVWVLCHDGKSRQARVSSFGQQRINRVSFKPAIGNSKYRIQYTVTPNHEWILSDGTRTTHLRKGDRIKIKPYIPDVNQDYYNGFAHGFVFGDGTRVSTETNQFSLPLCGPKDSIFREQLEKAQTFERTVETSYPWPVLFFKPISDWKEIPANGKSREYCCGFLEGVLAADSWSYDSNQAICLDNTSTELRDWVFSHGPWIGYVVTGISVDNRDTNYGKRNYPVQRIKLRREATDFAVEFILPAGATDVYCVTEPETSSFMLEGGVVTGNCAFTVIGKDYMADLEWLMDALMCGCGVGFRADRDDALTLPSVIQGTEVYEISDDREGWVASTVHLLSCIRDGVPIPVFDYNYIRPKGSPLKTFGGTASGPAPLMELHRRITMLCQMFADGTIDSVQLKTDLANCIGCCVVAGNIRRSAEIALGEMDDPVFSDLKNRNRPEIYDYRKSWAWMSNNSVLLRKKSDFDQLGDIAARVVINGEPGYLNLKNVKYGRIGDKKFVPDQAIGVNPCVIGSSSVLTPTGLRRIDSIHVGDQIWSETGWTNVTAVYDQGIKPVYRYHTIAGEIICTEDHKIVCDRFKMPVKDADSVDSLQGPSDWSNVLTDPYNVMLGLLHGDGQYAAPNTFLHIAGKDVDCFLNSEIKGYIGEKRDTDPSRHVYYSNVPYPMPSLREGRPLAAHIKYGDIRQIRSFLRGIYSANGCASGDRVYLTSTDHVLIVEVQKLLSALGIKAVIKSTGPHENTFKGETYTLSRKYNLTIAADCWKFEKYIGFLQPYKNEALAVILANTKKGTRDSKSTYDILGSEYVSEEKVYDITVDNYCHTFWCNGLNISNCGEIPLEDKELCNLAITCPTRCVDLGRWLRACEYATFYASTVALLPTHWANTNEVIARNRRIGVDILDFASWKQQMGTHWVISALRKGYDVVTRTNRRLAREAGVPASIRNTTMKPNGTVSKVIGTPSTYPNARYMLRAIRIAKGGSMESILKLAGVPHEPCVNQPEFTTIFYYPIYNGEVREIQEVSLWEQAANLILLQREWADNSVSNTLMFSEEERPQIEHVLSSCVPLTKSMSLNAHTYDTHPQMPETKITRGEYTSRLAEIKEIDWTSYSRDGAGERYCDAGSCDL